MRDRYQLPRLTLLWLLFQNSANRTRVSTCTVRHLSFYVNFRRRWTYLAWGEMGGRTNAKGVDEDAEVACSPIWSKVVTGYHGALLRLESNGATSLVLSLWNQLAAVEKVEWDDYRYEQQLSG
jgi:hypothetical protein